MEKMKYLDAKEYVMNFKLVNNKWPDYLPSGNYLGDGTRQWVIFTGNHLKEILGSDKDLYKEKD